jgi:hypothetical protein
MARPLGSGPIHVYIGFGPPAPILVGLPPVAFAGSPTPINAAGALYYGTTRSGVDTSEDLAYYQVMNDLTGPKQSLDDGYAGREDDFALTMSSWSQVVDNTLEQFLRPGTAFPPVAGAVGGAPAGAGRGVDSLSDLGTLMISEGKTVGIWLVKAAATKAVNVASGMPTGRYYYTCILAGPNKLVEGNKENLRIRTFHAKKNITALNTGNMPLFSENPVDFVGLPAAVFG